MRKTVCLVLIGILGVFGLGIAVLTLYIVPARHVIPGIAGFSLGLTSPVRLLRYIHDDRYPIYCRRTRILDQIKFFAERAQCQESEVAIGVASTRLITCNLPKNANMANSAEGASKCPAQYVALIWQERWPASTENYDLEMYARVRAQCGPNEDFATFHASDWHQRVASYMSEQLALLLNSCRSLKREDEL